jgi:CRISPR-associated endonuclease/helicase Cas3
MDEDEGDGMSGPEGYFRYWGKAEKEGPDYHLLVYHCLDVAAVGQTLLKNNSQLLCKFSRLTGFDEQTCKYWVLLFLTLHDLGKFSISFQGVREDLLERLQQIKRAKPYTVRHDSLGHLIWNEVGWKACLSKEMAKYVDYWEEIFRFFSNAFTGHHGVPPSLKGHNDMRLRLGSFFEGNDTDAAEDFVRDVSALFGKHQEDVSPQVLYELTPCVTWLLAGFVVVCDWIGSNKSWFRLESQPMSLEEYWGKHAVPQAIDAVRNAGIGSPCEVNASTSFDSVFPGIDKPSPLQIHISEWTLPNSPQLFILEDITGSGKTEAALFLARRMMARGLGSGIYLALPTMATSNAMFKRLAENPSEDEAPAYLRLFDNTAKPSVVLAHGARHLSKTFMNAIVQSPEEKNEEGQREETATAQCAAWLADNRKKALLADVGVGTLDQALLAVLPARFQSLRLFGLAGHILIVDEVHAYDPYMNKLLQNLLTFHAALGGSAILLSATLPRRTRQEMIESFAKGLGVTSPPVRNGHYPLATQISREVLDETPLEAMPERKTSVAIELVSDTNEVERRIVEASQSGKCVCWIRNTVHDALAAHEALKQVVPSDKLLFFHARFAMGDRLDIEHTVIDTFGKQSVEAERRGMVLIATQVVEQSLDLDFDLLVSDLAPMDLIIQRAGRLHRHLRDEWGNPLPADAGIDRREPPYFLIHSPEPLEDADGDWFKRAFPKAAYVYPSHGCLWLTARLLNDARILRMPDDAREFIEAAFDENSEKKIPPPLRQRDLKAEGEMMCDKSAAHINMLKLEEGYAATPNQWWEDTRTPTRLGDAETTVRLARWDGTNLAPWYTDSDFPWDMSQVNILSATLFSEAENHDRVLQQAVEMLKQSLPDKGKWSVLVPLSPTGGDCWLGDALDKDGKPVVVTYSREQGATVTRKE